MHFAFMKNKYSILALFSLLISFACQLEEEGVEEVNEQNDWESFQPFKSDYNSRYLEMATFFTSEAEERGEVKLPEVSGLAWSSSNPGFIWAHQDNKNENLLYLLDSQTGDLVATYRIKGIQNRDWEDIEAAPGPLKGRNYLYVGDIGDNDAVYGSYTICRFEEPLFQESHRGEIIDMDPEMDEIRYRYPGQDHDAETLMVDPKTKDIYVVTKRDLQAILYVAAYPQKLDEEFTLTKGGEFSFTLATAGSISKEGNEVLIKTYGQIFYWHRPADEHLMETLSRAPMEAPYNPREEQGEAICFDDLGGFYTLSELRNDIKPVLYYYPRQ